MRASQLLSATVLITVAITPVFAAAIPCQPASVAVYTQLADGCTANQFTIKNFAWSSAEGYLPVSASQVMVTPVITATEIEVGLTSDAFSVTGEQRIRAFLSYTIDPPPPILDDLNLSMDAKTPVAPGYARITAIICVGGYLTEGCADTRTLVVQHYGPGDPRNLTSKTEQFPGVNIIDVLTIVELFANGASSQIDGYGTRTSVLPNDETPEPSTAALMLAGIAGAIYLRRSRKPC